MTQEYRLVKGTWENIADGVLCEEETMPASCYLRDNSEYFLEKTTGDLTIVYCGEEPVGVGKFSVLPDGSGWLETLRVRPAWQGKGVGKSLYNKWMKEREAHACPAMRMFTGTANVRSKGLAEKYGLSLAGTMIGAVKKTAELGDIEQDLQLMHPVTDREEAHRLLERYAERMQGFVVLNNTFLRCNEKTWDYLFDNGMIFTDGESVAAVGARMLRERGLHLALYGGDSEKCLRFALAYTKAQGLPQLTVSYPPECEEIRKDMEAFGFVHDKACRIVMERVF